MPDAPSENGSPADDTTPADEEIFVNRAARRAKGKGGAKPGSFAQGQSAGGRGSVQSPRQYGNRRSG